MTLLFSIQVPVSDVGAAKKMRLPSLFPGLWLLPEPEQALCPHLSRQEKRRDLCRETKINEQWAHFSNIAGKDLLLFSGGSDGITYLFKLDCSTTNRVEILKHGMYVDDESISLCAFKIMNDFKTESIFCQTWNKFVWKVYASWPFSCPSKFKQELLVLWPEWMTY